MAALAHNDRVTPTVLAGCGGCLLLVVVAVVLLWVAASKTGLLPVPFPGVDTSPPAPSRTVEPSSAVDISKVIASAAMKSIGRGEGVEVVLTEGMLTALLRQTMEASGDVVVAERVQVAIENGGPVELYIPIVVQGRETVAIVRVLPTVVDGQPRIDIERLQLGRLRIPVFLTGNLTQKLTDTVLPDGFVNVNGSVRVDEKTAEGQAGVRITDVSLTQGAMTIRASVDPKALLNL